MVTLFDIPENMWNKHNKYCQFCKNINVRAMLKADQTFKLLYRICDLVIPVVFVTYFNIDLNAHLKNSLHLKLNWDTT